MEIVLARAASFATREGAFVVSFAGVNASVPGEMAGGGEGARACGADVLLLGLAWGGVDLKGRGGGVWVEVGGKCGEVRRGKVRVVRGREGHVESESART